MSLAVDLMFHLFFGKNPPTSFVMSPTTLSDWNILLGEADKLTLKELLKFSVYDVHLWGDDSNKGNEDRHVFGIHTWNPKQQCPVGYVLGNYLIASGSGGDQGEIEYHVAKKIYGINNVGGLICDNAKTQTGAIKGLIKINSQLFNREMFMVGCYPHVLNIMVRRMIYAGFGAKKDMEAFNLMQLHYKISWVHRGRPSFYKSMYVALGILQKEPPLPQQWVETRWTYFSESLNWWSKYGNACLMLGKKMLERLPKSDVHFGVWQSIIKMAANPMIQVQRAFLKEFLDIFVMPNLAKSESRDKELQFSSGYLARLWPSTKALQKSGSSLASGQQNDALEFLLALSSYCMVNGVKASHIS